MIACVFPGQGSQHVGMGKALADAHGICRDTFAEADAALGESLSGLCFSGPADALMLTENTQPAILAMSIAVYRLLASRGLQPAYVAGHSLGEYSAHVAAGTMAFADAIRVVRARGQFMQEAVPVGTGAMAAILGLDADKVDQACAEAIAELAGESGRDAGPTDSTSVAASSGRSGVPAGRPVVSAANLNGPGQVVIAGHTQAVARAGERAKALGAKRVIPLPVSAPFHCALMQPAQDRLTPLLRSVPVQDPQMPIVANVDAEPKRDAGAGIDALIRQVSSPVRWEAVVRRLASEGVRTYVEVGPGTVLAGLVRKIDREARTVSVSDEAGLAAVADLLA